MNKSADNFQKSSLKAINSSNSVKIEEDKSEIPLLSSRDMLSSIAPYDKTVELVGVVTEIQAGQTVGLDHDKIRFRFLLSNDEGTKIQVTCWNEQATRIEPLIHSNDVVHILNIMAKPVTRKYNWHGTFHIELVPDSRTQFNVYKKTPALSVSAEIAQAELVQLKEAARYENMIRVRGYLKAEFVLFHPLVQKGPSYGHGAITDGTYKLEVKFNTFSPDHSFKRGDFIAVEGRMQQHLSPIQILVNSIVDIKRIEGPPISIVKLISGSLPIPLKRANDKSGA